MASDFERFFAVIGGYGLWQVTVLLAGAFTGFVLTFNHSGYVFHSNLPNHWCSLDGLVDANWTLEQKKDIGIPKEKRDDGWEYSRCYFYQRNYTCLAQLSFEEARNVVLSDDDGRVPQLPCRSWEYDTSVFTLTTATEWNLVCGDTALRPTIQSVTMFGVLTSAVAFGPLADRFGRKRAIMIGVVMTIPLLISSAFVTNYTMFLVVRYFTSLFATGIYSTSFVLLSEVVTAQKRATTTILFDLGSPIGLTLWSVISYYFPDWRTLFMFVGGTSVLLIVFYWVLPESPRWLILHGRLDEAEAILQGAAKKNGRKLENGDEIRQLVHEFYQSEVGDDDLKKNVEKVPFKERLLRFFVLWRTPEMRFRSLVMFWTWFGISLVKFGLVLLAAKLPLSTHLVMIIEGLRTLVVRVLFIWPANRFGRRTIMSTGFLIITLGLFAMLFIPQSMPYVSWAVLLFATIGVAVNFCIIYLYTAELFPTKVRGLGVNIGSMHARIGAILAPYIVDLLGADNPTAPATIFTVVGFISAIATMFLPETRESPLPETVADVENRRTKRLTLQRFLSKTDKKVQSMQQSAEIPLRDEKSP